MKSAIPSAWRKTTLRCDDNIPLRNWLHDRGSLTARIQRRGHFSLRVAFQGLAKPVRDECQALAIPPRSLARTREVVLHCDGVAIVFAHTVLPRAPRGPLSLWLKRLGTRSLGALLFSHPGFGRGALFCRRLDKRHPLYRRAVLALNLSFPLPACLWARRSRFTYKRQSVLVTEVFSPTLENKPGNHSTRPNKPV